MLSVDVRHDSRVSSFHQCGGTHNGALACGSRVLRLFFIEDFRPAGRKSSIKGKKKYRSEALAY
jgi:hypothetical protein